MADSDMTFVFLLSCFLIPSLVSAVQDQKEVKVKPGQDVTLQCVGPTDASITLLEWNRSDLKSGGYVFFYRNERPYENYQHTFFRGRVKLKDPEMKRGDASVVLKNVTVNDTGTYDCRIIIINRGSNETTHSEVKHLIELKVTHSGHTPGNSDGYLVNIVLVIGGLFLLLMLVVCTIAVCIITRKSKKPAETPSYQPAEMADKQLI